MIKLGILGYPITHSLSPIMHKAALDHLGISGSYEVIETPPDELVDKVKYVRVNGFRGFNVTIPLKVWILPFLNNVDNNANVAGAVNTVVIDENKNLNGYNTDIYGFISTIPESIKKSLHSKKAAILGAGGAARAVALGLALMGLSEIILYSRNMDKSQKIREIICDNFSNIKVKTREFNEFADLSFASILINTTPVGMEGSSKGYSPLSKRSVQSLDEESIVYDLIYKPRKTKLIEYAQNRNLMTIDGSEMLVLQGVKALSLWINQEPPVDIMREAILKYI